MSTYLKPVLALIASVLLFAGVAYLADRELLDFIQTRFYNPSVINSYVKENIRDAEIAETHIFELQNSFALTLNEPAIRSSFHFNQEAADIYERSRIYGILLEATGGLQSVQFVDVNGLRIHYSTAPHDIISRNQDSTSYRNYTEDPLALPFDIVSVPANGSAKFTMDQQSDRIIYSFPFFDSMDVYRGTAIFTVSVRALGEKLIAEGRLKINDNISVVGSPPGILFGSPNSSRPEILSNVSTVWNRGTQGRATLDAVDSGAVFSLITFRTNRGIFFGRLVNDALFSISGSMRNILYLSMFLTFYLTLFFLLNFKANPVTLVRNRLRRLKESLFQQLYVNKSSQDRAKWILELEQRREGIRSELKGNLKLTRRAEKNIDNIINKSWDELLAIMKSGSYVSPVIVRTVSKTEPEDAEIEEVEEIEDIEEIEEFEEIEEIAEDIEEAEEIEELEDIEEVTEVEEATEIENMEETVEAEGIESVDEFDDVEITEEPEEKKPVRRGLLALASEIEFSHDDYSSDDTNGEDIAGEIDIVSPFSSMFSSLNDEKKAAD
jgi:hypothetical protein